MNIGFEALAEAYLEANIDRCDKCDKVIENSEIYETKDGDYVCLECHIGRGDKD
jgi:hypothetical protein